ncbi:MAG TPA: hypothetical protein DEQ47_08215 [Solibacterales bacterium]|nr:hypothetical protein [Bryobacterales bacterium]
MALQGKVVIVTGAGAGIGAAIAEVCAEYGANVVGSVLRRGGQGSVRRQVSAIGQRQPHQGVGHPHDEVRDVL